MVEIEEDEMVVNREYVKVREREVENGRESARPAERGLL